MDPSLTGHEASVLLRWRAHISGERDDVEEQDVGQGRRSACPPTRSSDGRIGGRKERKLLSGGVDVICMRTHPGSLLLACLHACCYRPARSMQRRVRLLTEEACRLQGEVHLVQAGVLSQHIRGGGACAVGASVQVPGFEEQEPCTAGTQAC